MTNISDFLIQYAHQPKLIKVNILKITNKKTTRYMDFSTVINGVEVSLNRFIAKQLGLSISSARNVKDSVIVHGSGSDMVFSTLYYLYRSLGLDCPTACHSYEI